MVFSVFAISYDQAGAQVQLCSITIEKQASPADNTGFTFTVEGPGNNFERILMDPSDNNFELFILLGNVEATVVEEVPEGWMLDDIECSGAVDVTITDVPNGKMFTCNESDGTAQCTFNNSQLPRNVPTLSKWGLIALAGVLGFIGLIVIRTRKATA